MVARPTLLTRRFALTLVANFALCTAKFLFLHIPGFFTELGAGEAEIGRILGTLAVASLLAGPLFGRLMDEHGRRIVFRSGGALFVASGALYLAIDRIDAFVYLVAALDGLSGGMLYLSLFTYGADQVPAERRTEGLALFGASALLPISVGAELGDRILAVGDYRDLIVTSVTIAFVGFLLTFALDEVHDTRGLHERSRGVFAAAREPRLLPMWLVAAGFFFASAALFMFFKTYVLTRGLGSVGHFFTVYAGVAVGLRLVAGWIPDRLGPTRVLGPALAFYVAGMLLLATATSATQVLLAAACCGVGHGYAYPVMFSLVIERSRPRELGSSTAVYTALDNGAHVAAGPAIGIVIEVAGYGAAFATLGAMIVAGCVGFYVLDRRPVVGATVG